MVTVQTVKKVICRNILCSTLKMLWSPKGYTIATKQKRRKLLDLFFYRLVLFHIQFFLENMPSFDFASSNPLGFLLALKILHGRYLPTFSRFSTIQFDSNGLRYAVSKYLFNSNSSQIYKW